MQELFSSFWEKAYIKHFDGDKLLIPAVHGNSEISAFSTLGIILVHGFFVCNFPPVRLAFPVIASVVCGTKVHIPDKILLESLIDFVSEHDGTILREAVGYQSDSTFPTNLRSKPIDILSKFECSEIPTPLNFKAALTNAAKYLFLVKPLGLTLCHVFWSSEYLSWFVGGVFY